MRMRVVLRVQMADGPVLVVGMEYAHVQGHAQKRKRDDGADMG